MKRCPNCNRSFPDDNQKFCTIDGTLLVAGDKPFDPNATIASSAPKPSTPPAQPPPEKPPTPQPDFGATVATTSSAPTVVLPKKTGPTGSPTSSNLHQPEPPQATQSSAPPPPRAGSAPPGVTTPPPAATPPPRVASAPLPQGAPVRQSAPLGPQVPPAVPKKKSKLPLILGILAILFVLGVGAVVAAFFLVIKPRLNGLNSKPAVAERSNSNESANTNTNANTNTASETSKTESEKTESEFVPPPNTTKFTNSPDNLDGKLAEHYFDFSFYYPDNWVVDPKAGVRGASNFAKVERRLPPDSTQENFAVGWYTSKGTFEADESTFPQLVEVLGSSLAKTFPGYEKVSEGPTKVNSLQGYEFRFVSTSKGGENSDLKLWGRVVFLPTGVAGDQTGATLVMLATPGAPELSGVEDVGEKGQMPVVLESFRFGKGR